MDRPDPQPGDFDADLTGIDPRYIDAHVGNPNVKLTIVLGVGSNSPRAATSAPLK